MIRAAVLLVALQAVSEPQDWVEALKRPSSGKKAVPDEGDFGVRPGWISEPEEESLLSPFGGLTEDQARTAIPLLLKMIQDATPVFVGAES